VAAVLRATVRTPDTCFRWGGDEFALLLEETTHADAEAVAERVAGALRGEGALSLGYGIAQLAAGERPEDLLARADEALLVAKAATT
jgi:diguanylate cyclase (GGDEF)-like protein